MEQTPNQQAQAAREQAIEICREILINARNELYLNMHFLDLALSALRLTPESGITFLGTDGDALYYAPKELLETYQQSRILINRAYLHSVLHCLFGHMDGRKEREEKRWNLACDAAVESILDTLYYPALHMPVTALRRKVYTWLKTGTKVLNAERIYYLFEAADSLPWSEEELAAAFWADDHSRWQDRKNPARRDRQKKWEDIRERMETEMETFSKKESAEAKDLLDQVRIQNRPRQDYREFLRKFAVMKEVVQIDTDSFDYIFYDYGMRMYGDMPLIEPLETKETRRIEDFVIVIDTSMSCSGTLVRKFLEQTYAVLTEAESFFTRIRVHIIQCDEKVQSDAEIRSMDELKDYMEHLEIWGQGGTDFRPAFAYVEELIARRAFDKLKGLIYFTDGYGTYPVKMPPYETAFVFLKEDYTDLEVPPWAIKLVLAPEEFETDARREGHYEY
jgi:predicted metal-dependent peptidase